MIFVASAQPTPRTTTPYIPHHLSLYPTHTPYPTPSGVGGWVYITPLPTPIKGGRLTRRTVFSPKFSKNFRRFQKAPPLSSRRVCFSKIFPKKIQSHRLFISIIYETIE